MAFDKGRRCKTTTCRFRSWQLTPTFYSCVRDITATIGWGIAGTGRIARTILDDFAHVPGARISAVASRSLARAGAFARGKHFPNGVDSEASMLLTFLTNKFATLAISLTSNGPGRMTRRMD